MWQNRIILLMLAVLMSPVSDALAQTSKAPKVARWVGLIIALAFILAGGLASVINPRRSQRD